MKKTCLILISSCFLLVNFSSCNVVEPIDAGKTSIGKNNPLPYTKVSYEAYHTLSTEEQWRSFSPQRRNSLRENPNKYPRFKGMIAAEPAMEQEPAKPSVPADYQNHSILSNPVPQLTPLERWNRFSVPKKQYIKSNIEQYPEFKDFVE